MYPVKNLAGFTKTAGNTTSQLPKINRTVEKMTSQLIQQTQNTRQPQHTQQTNTQYYWPTQNTQPTNTQSQIPQYRYLPAPVFVKDRSELHNKKIIDFEISKIQTIKNDSEKEKALENLLPNLETPKDLEKCANLYLNNNWLTNIFLGHCENTILSHNPESQEYNSIIKTMTNVISSMPEDKVKEDNLQDFLTLLQTPEQMETCFDLYANSSVNTQILYKEQALDQALEVNISPENEYKYTNLMERMEKILNNKHIVHQEQEKFLTTPIIGKPDYLN